nr:MAG TPA: hypothetical protein [Bacteriophage sp.]
MISFIFNPCDREYIFCGNFFGVIFFDIGYTGLKRIF